MPPLVWLITGCSTGFGAEFVKAVLAKGDKAIATARRLDSLRDLAAAGAATLQLDVAATTDEIREKVDEAVKIYGRVDVLLSNAGYSELKPVEVSGSEGILRNMQTNTFATVKLIQAIMPHWRAQRSGYLVVNSSICAWWEMVPCLGAYAASKAALDQIVNHFAAEVADLGFIKTLIIDPGYFQTALADPAKHGHALSAPWPGYEALREFMNDFAPKLHGSQPGDTVKGARLVVDLVKGEGVAQGRELPAALPMGTDAFVKVKEHCEKTLKVLEEWEEVIKSTDLVKAG